MTSNRGWVRGGMVTSADGTEITYLTRGRGPVIVGLHGGLGTALSLMPLAGHLADRFTVALVNLRGHGTSQRGCSAPHIDRYTEDVGAVINTVGPIEALFGYSFGAVIALETALSAPELVPRLALYEPPLPATYPTPDRAWMARMLDQGRYEELVLHALAQGGGGLSPAEVAGARDNPLWLSNVAHAPTLLPTMQVLAEIPADVHRYATLTTPTTLISGTTSATFLHDAIGLLAEVLPHSRRVQLARQGHHVDPAQLAVVLAALTDGPTGRPVR
ncbi:alpha/beta hydrolase [Mycolicibacterium wolinskyi]|uniref:Hydrolase n=1 Tax=Mycolicibacterium wolinskyi TaxID=59750 RepID=A0A1X2FIZ0_9MYCO|nr:MULTISPECIES: alpha/beta hydrolase [Mycolicibacterium]MCV7288164.1 alpha/beta hydrolase [Mycolicibacterium wolinskyi]MCV7296889.1 alpha/beta hydrolase [Mycolicibacterium goodii]ORX18405.1 hydrolase [Mycolicibacterium wolinskyi]